MKSLIKQLKLLDAPESSSSSGNEASAAGAAKMWQTARDRYSFVKQDLVTQKLESDSSDTEEKSEKASVYSVVKKAIRIHNQQFVSEASLAWLQESLHTSNARQKQIRYTYKRGSHVASENCKRITKYNPIFNAQRPHVTRDMYNFEKKQFQNTMKSMGGLKRVDRPVPPTDRGPYHCPTDHDMKRSVTVLEPLPKIKVKKTAKTPCNTVNRGQIPTYTPYRTKNKGYFDPTLLTNTRPEQQTYFPKSTVRVRYPGTVNICQSEFICDALDSQASVDVCKLMTGFGPVLFMTTEGKNSMLVTFELMKSAYRARVSTQYAPGVSVEWLDKRFDNFGHLTDFLGYAVSKDKVWKEILNKKYHLHPEEPTRRSPIVIKTSLKNN